MPQHRVCRSAEFEAKVALVALSESQTIAEPATEIGVHPTQITCWKQELSENAVALFGKVAKKKEVNHEEGKNDETHFMDLSEKVENVWAKNSLLLGPPDSFA